MEQQVPQVSVKKRSTSIVVGAFFLALFVSLILTIGDLPRGTKDLGPSDFPSFSFGTGSKKELNGLTIQDGMPVIALTVGMRPAPFVRPYMFASVLVAGYKKEPGTIHFLFTLPKESRLLMILRTNEDGDLEESPAPGPTRHYGSTSASTEVYEISVTTTEVDQYFSAGMYFEVMDPKLTQYLGWGRQHLLVGYEPNSYDDGQNVGDLRTESGQPAYMQIVINGRAHQQILDPIPSTNIESPSNVSWNVPDNGGTFYAQATIEDGLIRYFANLGPQVLFLALGVLLGGFLPFREKYNDKAPPHQTSDDSGDTSR